MNHISFNMTFILLFLTQIHLNFPNVITTDTLAQMCRDEIVLRCRKAFVATGEAFVTPPSNSNSVGSEPMACVDAAAQKVEPGPCDRGEGDEGVQNGGQAGRQEDTEAASSMGTGRGSVSAQGVEVEVEAPPSVRGTESGPAGREGAPPCPHLSELDWERIVDFPHGSLRLLGSRKAKHMSKSDPSWVRDKASPARLYACACLGLLQVVMEGSRSIFPP